MTWDGVRQAVVVGSVVGGIVSGATGDYGEAGPSPSLVLPADYAFTIWGPIYAGSIVYAVQQARPSRRADPVFRRTGWAAAAAYGLAGTWVRVQRHPRLQLAVIGATAAATALSYARARPATPQEQLSAQDRWTVRVPLGLFAGWITLATAAGGTEAIMAARGGDLPVDHTRWAVGVLTVTGAAVATIGRRAPLSPAYPAAVSWGLIGTAVRSIRRSRGTGLLAAAAAAVVMVPAVLNGRRAGRTTFRTGPGHR
jgi:hypothetical protein